MACQISITAVNGIVLAGQTDPGKLRVLGTASDCGQVTVSSPAASASQTVSVDPNGHFRAEITITPIPCGQPVAVHVECAGQSGCFADYQQALACCEVTRLFFQAVTPAGSLNPTLLSVSGTMYGCASDQVVITSSVTVASNPIQVDFYTGSFSTQLPITMPIQCDQGVWVTATCAGTGCDRTEKGPLQCPDCYRAAVTVDSSAQCAGSPQVKPITLQGSIAIPTNAIRSFHWEFGDGSRGPNFIIDNTGGTGATAHLHAENHDYVPGTYTATLKINPPPSECREVSITVVAQCGAVDCPTVVVDPPQIASQCVNGKQTVTLTTHITASSAAAVVAQWNFGDGAMGAAFVVNGGPIQTIQTHDYAPGNYSAILIIVSPTGCPPVPPVPLSITCTPPTCALLVQGINASVGGCNPVTGTKTVTATAVVNSIDPNDRYYWQWDSNPAQNGLPPAQGNTQQHDYLAPGSGRTSYTVTLTVVRNSSCISTFALPISIDGCAAPCPTVTDISIASGACASGANSRAVVLSAQVSGGNPGSYDWNFGDQSPVFTGSTPVAPSHNYPAPGNFTATVTAHTPNCPDSTVSKSVPVASCGGNGGGGLPSCSALLWAAIILMLIGGLVSVLGCILAHFYPQAGLIVGIVGVALFVVGALLYLIWWILCRFLTACAVILAARDFVMVLIVVFGVIAAIIAIVAIFTGNFWPCAAAATIYGLAWGLVLTMLDLLAQNRHCILINPSGGSSPGSSSSGLTSSSGGMRLRVSDFAQRSTMAFAGMGDVVAGVTSAVGVQPCAGCHKRAEQLNRMFPI